MYFFGFQAVERIRIVQKQVMQDIKTDNSEPKSLNQEEKIRLEQMLKEIDDPELRQVLEKLGAGIISKAEK